MAARDLNVAVYVLQADSSHSWSRARDQYSYTREIDGGQLQTLSQRNPNNFEPVSGLLFAPDPATPGACSNSTLQIFPSNVTKLDTIPGNTPQVMSVFPWDDISCTKAFLNYSSAQNVRAAIVFNTRGGNPPGPGDPSWSLMDNGQWRNANNYPIYAVSTEVGIELLRTMAQYSGNVSSAPYSSVLQQTYPPQAYPRIGIQADLDGTSVPSLWTFLIIVLAVLLGLVISASVVMHFIQRHQRRSLQRRLQRGEVDLESLGIKRINVPQEKIDEMPQYVFSTKGDDSMVSPATGVKKIKAPETSFSQSTCPICLDDFVTDETNVRELPCKHVFHPDCIDPFLRDNSSLCPMCKKSALPQGYCPVKVTNMMVRRERLVRRMRERRRQSLAQAFQEEPRTGFQIVLHWIKTKFRLELHTPTAPAPASRAVSSAQPPEPGMADQSNDVELAHSSINQRPNRRESEIPLEIARQGTAARRAWRRERLAQQQQQSYNEQAERTRRADEGRSWTRRAVDRVLPGFG